LWAMEILQVFPGPLWVHCALSIPSYLAIYTGLWMVSPQGRNAAGQLARLVINR